MKKHKKKIVKIVSDQFCSLMMKNKEAFDTPLSDSCDSGSNMPSLAELYKNQSL